MSAAVDTAFRLRRLLAILAWLAQVGEAPIDQAAARFDLTPEALVTELEMAACCGVPPYTPDQLMEIVVTDTTVSVRVGTALARPRRLTPTEGFALAASARALLAVPGSDGSGALSTALAKLDRALGGQQVGVELDAPAWLDVVREALSAGTRLAISYYSASTDRVSEREIDPVRLFASEGHWYVDAHCSLAGEVRRFRVDRINAAEPVGTSEGSDRAGPPPGAAPDSADGSQPDDLEPYVPGPDSRKVRISLPEAAAWLVDSIPVAAPAVTVDGHVEIEVFVGGDAWLERLLLRLGPDSRVVDPPGYRQLGVGGRRPGPRPLPVTRRRRAAPSGQVSGKVAGGWPCHTGRRGRSRPATTGPGGRGLTPAMVLRIHVVREGGHAYYVERPGARAGPRGPGWRGRSRGRGGEAEPPPWDRTTGSSPILSPRCSPGATPSPASRSGGAPAGACRATT